MSLEREERPAEPSEAPQNDLPGSTEIVYPVDECHEFYLRGFGEGWDARQTEFAQHIADRDRFFTRWTVLLNGLRIAGYGNRVEAFMREGWRAQFSHAVNSAEADSPIQSPEQVFAIHMQATKVEWRAAS